MTFRLVLQPLMAALIGFRAGRRDARDGREPFLTQFIRRPEGRRALLLEAFRDRIINVHPSLLPAFAGGMDAVEQALAAGVTTTGATVHVVTDALDAGLILAQESVEVLPGETVETLRQRVHEVEYRLLPAAIRLMEARIAKSSAVG